MQVSDDPRVGTELAGYRIESLLGWGGMSVSTWPRICGSSGGFGTAEDLLFIAQRSGARSRAAPPVRMVQ